MKASALAEVAVGPRLVVAKEGSGDFLVDAPLREVPRFRISPVRALSRGPEARGGFEPEDRDCDHEEPIGAPPSAFAEVDVRSRRVDANEGSGRFAVKAQLGDSRRVAAQEGSGGFAVEAQLRDSRRLAAKDGSEGPFRVAAKNCSVGFAVEERFRDVPRLHVSPARALSNNPKTMGGVDFKDRDYQPIGLPPSALAEVVAGSRRVAAKEGSGDAAVEARHRDVPRLPISPARALLDGPETRGEVDLEDRDYDYDAGLEAAILARQLEDLAVSMFDRRIAGTRHRCGESGVEIVFNLARTTFEVDKVSVNGRMYLPVPQHGGHDRHGFLLTPLGPGMMTGDNGAAYEVWINRAGGDPEPEVTLTRFRNFEVEEEMACMQA